MSSPVRVVKSKDREKAAALRTANSLPEERRGTQEIVETIKNWIAESRARRQEQTELAFKFTRGADLTNLIEPFANAVRSGVKVLLVAGLLVLSTYMVTPAQSPLPLSESLSLDQAVEIALRNNPEVKIAQFEVAKAGEDISVAKTARYPSLQLHTLVSTNLAKNDIRVPNPTASEFPGLGPFFLLSQERKVTTVFAATAVQPLSQQYRIGLNIKLEQLSREIAQAKLRQQQNETVDQVKKAYYAILQTKSALGSSEEVVRSYQELERVTGTYVIKQVALRVDYLTVQTRLAKAQYAEYELSSRLATQKEQLNVLLGREVTHEFDVSDASALLSVETDLAAARTVALAHRPELQQARLSVEQANLARRIKKSEYIPDVSAGFVYATPRNFPSVVPRQFANVGIMVTWEIFDWGRKKHELARIDNTIEQAKNVVTETEDRVLVDVGDKWRKLRLAGQALRVAMVGQETAKENLRVNTGQYSYQTVLLSDVLKSQASLTEATDEYQRALSAFWIAKADLERAVGEER